VSDQPIDRYRRRLLGGAVAAGTLTLAPGVFLHRIAEAKPDAEPVTSIVRWGLLVDTHKCSDCTAGGA
jgi:molybdopterin-containing oxidoreductase family iron-sulfur binding subunit